MLDLYGAVEESSLAVSELFFDEAEQAHEALINMLDQVAAGQEVQPQPERVQALRDLLGLALDPSATGLIKSDGSQVQRITDLAQATAQLSDEQAVALDWDALDDEIVEIFLEEAVDILDSAGQALQRWLDEPDSALPLPSLQRDLHTLKGGARMAEIGPVGDLAHELEALYEGLSDRRFSHSPELAELLISSHDQLAHMLDQLQSKQPLSDPTELVAAINAVRLGSAIGQGSEPQDKPEPAAPAPDGPDAELLEIFLEEGFDIIERDRKSVV